MPTENWVDLNAMTPECAYYEVQINVAAHPDAALSVKSRHRLRGTDRWCPIMPFSFLGKRVSLDAGRNLWNTPVVEARMSTGPGPL